MKFIPLRQAIVLLLSVAFAPPILAGETQTTEVTALKQADQKLASREHAVKRLCGNYGSPSKTRQQSIHCTSGAKAKRAQLKEQRAQVQALLDQLEAGQAVDPVVVDRVLRDAGISND